MEGGGRGRRLPLAGLQGGVWSSGNVAPLRSATTGYYIKSEREGFSPPDFRGQIVSPPDRWEAYILLWTRERHSVSYVNFFCEGDVLEGYYPKRLGNFNKVGLEYLSDRV